MRDARGGGVCRFNKSFEWHGVDCVCVRSFPFFLRFIILLDASFGVARNGPINYSLCLRAFEEKRRRKFS